MKRRSRDLNIFQKAQENSLLEKEFLTPTDGNLENKIPKNNY